MGERFDHNIIGIPNILIINIEPFQWPNAHVNITIKDKKISIGMHTTCKITVIYCKKALHFRG